MASNVGFHVSRASNEEADGAADLTREVKTRSIRQARKGLDRTTEAHAPSL